MPRLCTLRICIAALRFSMHVPSIKGRGFTLGMWSAQLSGSAGSQDLGSDKIVTITAPVLPTGAAAAPPRPASKLSTSSSANADPSDPSAGDAKIYKMPSIGVLHIMVVHSMEAASA